MFLWDAIVDFLRLFILTQAQVCGGSLGGGILLASVFFRAALFPLTSRIAKSSRAHQQALEELKPPLEEILKEFRDQPERRAKATQELFQTHGVSQIPAGCVGGLSLAPLYFAFFASVRQVADVGGRFFWIRNIARPDLWLTVIVAGITFVSVLISASPPQSPEVRRMMLLVPVIVTVAVLLQTSAGVALYFGVSSAASLVQNWLLRRSIATT